MNIYQCKIIFTANRDRLKRATVLFSTNTISTVAISTFPIWIWIGSQQGPRTGASH